MEGALEADHRLPPGVGARELDGVLDRLGAGVEERGLGRARERRQGEQALGESRVHLVGHDGEVGMREALELLLRGSDDVRMGVADVQAADAAGEVDEHVVVDVGDRRSPRARRGDREGDRKRARDTHRQPIQDRLRARARNGGLQLDRLRRRHASEPSGSGRVCIFE